MTQRARISLLFAGIAALASPSLDAQQTGALPTWSANPETGKAARHEAREFRQLQVPGDTVEYNVRKLTKELHWHNTLSGALRAGGAQGKPVLWIQALGDLDGFL